VAAAAHTARVPEAAPAGTLAPAGRLAELRSTFVEGVPAPTIIAAYDTARLAAR
jgi:hypothetical protein